MTTWTSEDRENAMKEDDEYSGGIPIVRLRVGWWLIKKIPRRCYGISYKY